LSTRIHFLAAFAVGAFLQSPRMVLAAIGPPANYHTIAEFGGELDTAGGPFAGVTFGPDGNLYGSLTRGPIFKVTLDTNILVPIAQQPTVAKVTFDSSGNLYGTSGNSLIPVGMGEYGFGQIFKINAGSTTLTTFASFDRNNGAYPTFGGVIFDTDGNLYGATSYGGANHSAGTVYEVAAGSNAITLLASFGGSNGAGPSSLVMDSAGNLFGTTATGGPNNSGTLFEIVAGTHDIVTLAAFGGANGVQPGTTLALDDQGNLYGTTLSGGVNGGGTVFKFASDQTFTTLFSFSGTNGSEPFGGLLVDKAGNIFGTTNQGGLYNDGTLFRLSTDNTLTTLVTFNREFGSSPYGDLIADKSGKIFGTTFAGGANDNGTVFELTDTGFVVPESSSFLLVAFGLIAFAIPCIKQVREAK